MPARYEHYIVAWPGRMPRGRGRRRRTRRRTKKQPAGKGDTKHDARTRCIGGVNAAVLTPMRADLSVDLDRMAAHCRWLLANGCDGLAILGTTGEANSLGVDERIAVMEGLVERGIPAAQAAARHRHDGDPRHRAC